MSAIQQFYAGQNVLVTGGTGFVGKILTEKLLRSCPNIGTIYLLVRSKKGKETHERVDQLLSDSVFDIVREQFPEFRQKVVAIIGDGSSKNLGLSETDRSLLLNEVNRIMLQDGYFTIFNSRHDRGLFVPYSDNTMRRINNDVNIVTGGMNVARPQKTVPQKSFKTAVMLTQKDNFHDRAFGCVPKFTANTNSAAEVSIVFHVAATVRFDEKLNQAVATNVNSVKDIVDLSRECKNLKASIHVSTAYSYCVRDDIDEMFYPPPLNYDEVNAIIDIANKRNWSEQTFEDVAQKVIGKWPNTYTFTKAIGESVISEYARDLPYAVFRPSIVLATYKEPISGWCDNFSGVNGIISGVGTGVLHAMHLDLDVKCDLVPVDMVCNAMIAIAWKTATTDRRPQDDIPVYNYVSGPENPITWGKFATLCDKYGRIRPTNAAIYYNSVIYTRSRLLAVVLQFFFHLIPALIIDSFTRLLGKKPILYKLHKKVANLTSVLAFFTTQQWAFKNQRTQDLWNRLGDADKGMFPFSMRMVDWTDLLQAQVYGVRKYLLNDVDGNEDTARRRQNILYIIHIAVRALVASSVLWIVWKIFCGRNFSIITGIVNIK